MGLKPVHALRAALVQTQSPRRSKSEPAARFPNGQNPARRLCKYRNPLKWPAERFAFLLRQIFSPLTSDHAGGFIAEVNVVRRLPPNPRVLRFIFICWLLIALKHLAVIYACLHWPVPFHQLWINAPTFALGLLATLAYWGRVHPLFSSPRRTRTRQI